MLPEEMEVALTLPSGIELPVLIAMGISFYQEVNGRMHRFLGRDANYGAIMHVDIPKNNAGPAIIPPG